MVSAMHCKVKTFRQRGNLFRIQRNLENQKHACIVEAHESTRERLEETLPKNHEDHIDEKGLNSVSHHNLVHNFLPMLQAMTFPDGKAAVDKVWEKLEGLPVWHLTKVRSNKEVSLEAQRGQRTVHFATLMDICHFKKSQGRTEVSEIQKARLCSEVTLSKRPFRLIRCIHRTRFVCVKQPKQYQFTLKQK